MKLPKLPTLGGLPALPSLPALPFQLPSMPDWNWLRLWLRTSFKSTQQSWSALTCTRRVDVIVGLTLHCLLMSLHVLVSFVARGARCVLLVLNTVLFRLATAFGFVRPLRLLRDTPEVRQQLETATILSIAGYNLVLFEGLKK
ncbi:uncharacterized protein [Littorina saxatilis]|uniref:Uncharacterized protein n=1 Tax=Littorina saxatilis TaxID=31220 RepID=A0AAN9ARI9_9CAEN